MSQENVFKEKFKGLINQSFSKLQNVIQYSPEEMQVRPARLIPLSKPGDELSMSSIFLSSLRLVKEFREDFFKEIGLSRAGKAYYYTEPSFPTLDPNARIDGLILVVVKDKIIDGAFFEMKVKNNPLDKEQMEKYLALSKKLGIQKLISISNDYVSNPTISPVGIKVKGKMSLLHFSWTYLQTRAQLLLYKNDRNIEDEDQVEIMSEVLEYMKHPKSGIQGFSSMKPGWKQLTEAIRDEVKLTKKDLFVSEAISSWYEAEKQMALKLSDKLEILVSTIKRPASQLEADIEKLVREGSDFIKGGLTIKGADANISIFVNFKLRRVSMAVKVIPDLSGQSNARITWLMKQIEKCNNKVEGELLKQEKHLSIEADIKKARKHLKSTLTCVDDLREACKGKEIQAFHFLYEKDLGQVFVGNQKFIKSIDDMLMFFYESVVQHISSHKATAPKLRK